MEHIIPTEELKKLKNGSIDCRTRCIYENGTESDIYLQTLRKNVVSNGYAVTETEEEITAKFFTDDDLTPQDVVSGYIYVLSSLSEDSDIAVLKLDVGENKNAKGKVQNA